MLGAKKVFYSRCVFTNCLKKQNTIRLNRLCYFLGLCSGLRFGKLQNVQTGCWAGELEISCHFTFHNISTTTKLHRQSQRFWICTFFSAVAGSQLDERRRGAAGDQTWTAEQCWSWRPTGTFEQDSIRLPSGTDKVGKFYYIFIIFSHRSPCWWVNRSSVPASCPGILCFSGTVGRRWQAFCGQMSPSCPAPPHCTWQP